ncbi:unnamed protein product [Prorocentrum cordatum]|uniref:Uncharacterized protein n=1 Tax=Prorocentrum cordatum TaxID=2364126 RepID=A0ABN9TIH1_9DINO|nr:unnamed protein product [Polarella glacialis]
MLRWHGGGACRGQGRPASRCALREAQALRALARRLPGEKEEEEEPEPNREARSATKLRALEGAPVEAGRRAAGTCRCGRARCAAAEARREAEARGGAPEATAAAETRGQDQPRPSPGRLGPPCLCRERPRGGCPIITPPLFRPRLSAPPTPPPLPRPRGSQEGKGEQTAKKAEQSRGQDLRP